MNETEEEQILVYKCIRCGHEKSASDFLGGPGGVIGCPECTRQKINRTVEGCFGWMKLARYKGKCMTAGLTVRMLQYYDWLKLHGICPVVVVVLSEYYKGMLFSAFNRCDHGWKPTKKQAEAYNRIGEFLLENAEEYSKRVQEAKK